MLYHPVDAVAAQVATQKSVAAEMSAVPEPGVGRDLARFRAAHYHDVHYDLQLELAPGAAMLTGHARIRVTLESVSGPLILDWRTLPEPDPSASENRPATRNHSPAHVWNMRANGQQINDAVFINDHILIGDSYLRAGENTVELSFESPIAAAGSAVTRYRDHVDQAEYVYTLFVPSDSSTTFPCFDQPDLKARFRLEMQAPTNWKIISNTEPETTTTEAALSNDGGSKAIAGQGQPEHVTAEVNPLPFQKVLFYETQPISTYLFAFAAGPFAEFQPTPHEAGDGVPLRLFVRQSKAAQARQEMAEVFRLNREGLKFLAAYFDVKFPFPKYDLVLVPEFAYGGMEHAGATFLREDIVLFPSDPTATDLLRRAETILHEASHQWFGDLVTMRWFDDLWLKEGFATFMAYKAMEVIMPPVMPQFNTWKLFYQRTKPGAYATDATKGTTPIFQGIANLSAAKSAYGNIVYLKAPSILRQAEFLIGATHFQQAVRLFVQEHEYGNAEWSDLVHALERTSGHDLKVWAASWVQRRGMPGVRVDWKVDRHHRIQQLVLHEQDVLGEGGSWPLRLQVLLAYPDGETETLTVDLPEAGATPVPAAIGKPGPAYVFANYQDYGYGRFLLDASSQRAVQAHLNTIHDDFLRALLWGALWDSVREAQLAPATYIALGLEFGPQEHDAVVVQSILARVARAFNYYLSAKQQQQLAPRLEAVLADRMIDAATVDLRITYFRTFRLIATSPAARNRLKQILSGAVSIPGMTRHSRDRFDIVEALLARGDTDALQLLSVQQAADTSDDGRRYAYAAGAARPDAATKQAYFTAYLGDKALAESWLEESLDAFNTVEQAELTLRYLAPALQQLPVLKRTRKIFFVNNWLAAFIGGQNSSEALTIVQNFLQQEPGLDPDLRRKVLEATDGLERCVRIRNRYARR
ncbi:MAG: ERAP1-like C-terminal domain-containing protein [Abitibacteriaceae bacterium]|nr:ERAP1-like C-terminal domain-containing protein [Abditibacteriaceae bacterium]